jgi:5'-3' exonuclease
MKGSTKSTAAVLFKYGHLEAIPDDWRTWSVNAANAAALALTLARERDRAFLFRDLATLRSHLPLFEAVDELWWNGPKPEFASLAARLDTAVGDARPGPRKTSRPSMCDRG